MRDGDNNTEVLVQYFKLVTFHDRPPCMTHPTPPIALMMSCDVTWHHWCYVAPPPLHSWTLILWLHFFFYLSLVMSWETFPHSYTSPHIHSWIFEALLNNFISHLSWFKKLSLTHTYPLKTSHELLKHYELLFSELESLIKCWMWIEWIFSQFTFNILWVTLTQKIITHRVSKIHERFWGNVYEQGKVSETMTSER